jgi:formylglycine-generating enzyme required for sulfatase activity
VEIIHARQYADWTKIRQHDTIGAMDQGHESRKLRQPSRRALVTACVLGLVLVGSVGVWLAVTHRTSVPPKVTRVQPSPVPVQAPATHVQPAPSSGPLSLERERALQPKDSFTECNNCPELVVAPDGSFMMGSPNSESFMFMMGSLNSEQRRGSDESPQRRVTIAKPFAVGRFAVTFDEWDACVADGGCNVYKPADQGWGRGQRPVINVSWNDTKIYLAWLSRKTGKPYRLLSEAEFEYVARAGSKTAYPWGAEIGKGNANCDGCGSQWDQTAPVGSFAANAFGLYDMAENPCGRDSRTRLPPCNVWEWVEDCDHGNYNGAPADGSAWISGDCSDRVVRGGVWYYYPQFLRSAYRSRFATDYRNYFLGFRVGRTLTP